MRRTGRRVVEEEREEEPGGATVASKLPWRKMREENGGLKPTSNFSYLNNTSLKSSKLPDRFSEFDKHPIVQSNHLKILW